MRIGIVIHSSDQESLGNALRFALVALEDGCRVRIFAMGKGVEVLNNPDENNLRLMEEFISKEGKIVA